MKSPLRNLYIRPTEDFVREAVFNILQASVAGSEVVDFFAGTGAMGLEALSRGANSATLVDSSPQAVKIISQNIEILGYKEKTDLIKGDVFAISKRLIANGRLFDIIFLDPPYQTVSAERAFSEDFISKLLAEGGIAAIETDVKFVVEKPPPGCKVVDHRKWGKCAYVFVEAEKK